MRTENPTFPAALVARVRAQVHRVRRSLGTQPPILRWALPLGALAAVIVLAYVAAPLPSGNEFLREGQPFSSDDLIKLRRAFDAKHLAYRVDSRGRVQVSSDQLDDARDVLAKLDIGPQSIDEIRNRAFESSPWDSLLGTQEKRDRGREEELESYIRKLDGIVSAHVRINRTRTRTGLRIDTQATAFVWIETEENRDLGPTAVQSIRNIIGGFEPDLKPGALTITDQKGHPYAIAGNPSLDEMTTDRAREAEYTEKILEKLDWVRGARVSVQMVPPPSAAAPNPAPAKTPEAPAPTEPAVVVNQPLELVPPALPGPAFSSATVSPAAKPVDDRRMARVLVYVPRSFYLKSTPIREPSQDDLQLIVLRTEERIKTAVGFVVPPSEPHEVIVETIPDDEPASPPLVGPVNTDARRSIPWWVPAATAGAGMATLLFAAFRMLAARRPESRTPSAPHRSRYKVDTPSEPGPGPSERVRELIRLNPESAASVLHRWIGQGGESA
jgi:flagellar biosynthesis/type III secretory pathway M-ring protein FliF/YscJ